MILPQTSSPASKDNGGKSITSAEVLNLTPQQQDTVANFDKISFLSDQVIFCLIHRVMKSQNL